MEEQLQQWREVQKSIASQVTICPDEYQANSSGYRDLTFSTKKDDAMLLGGVDVSFSSGEKKTAIAVYVVTRNEDVVYQDVLEFELTVPYFSSYLAFREIEPLTQLVMKQRTCNPEVTPAVILVDGNGIFHERGAGIASFLGVRTNMKTIGIGKTLYCMDGLDHAMVETGLEVGLDRFLKKCRDSTIDNIPNDINLDFEHEKGRVIMIESAIQPKNYDLENEDQQADDNIDDISTGPSFRDNIESASQYCDGFSIPLKGRSGSTLAAVLVGHGGKIGRRAASGKAKKGGTKIPIFISIGHKISLQEAVQICASVSYARIPESVRQADLIGRQIMREKNM
jgi:deoxyinosine 3'endonuclease (endonuclease V)